MSSYLLNTQWQIGKDMFADVCRQFHDSPLEAVPPSIAQLLPIKCEAPQTQHWQKIRKPTSFKGFVMCVQ